MENINIDLEQAVDESLEKILNLLEEKQYFKARDEICQYNAVDESEMLEEVIDEAGIEKAVILFRLLPKATSVDVFSFLPTDDQLAIIDAITDSETTYIIDELDFDDKIDVLEELPANVVDKILEKTPKHERKLINTFLNYPDDSAGSLMTPNYISLKKDWSVAEALAHIKEEGMDAETIYTCYVKESDRRLIGIVSLSTLVTKDDNIKIKEIMVDDYVWLDVNDDQEEVADTFKKYGFLALPVVDKEHRLVGIVTVDDVLDVMEEEATEDIERMAGVIDFEDSDREYLDIPVWKHAINRLPWLLILMVAYIFTGQIVASFENQLSAMTCLIIYMPMLMGTGGNTGSQAATLIIRGLATDEVDLSDTLKILWKEFRVGVLLGVLLSLFNFLRIVFIDGETIAVAMTVCLAMIFIVIFAKILGSMVPILVKACKLDPALIANPAISSISDAVALTIYFVVASLVLGI
ncbi:MAG: magnesium transporter [Clostridia bacterium]|nr:magnesium transporter [Clostridia bacterium]